MNKMTKKTAFGITGAAAATLMVVGFAGPAMADDSSSSDYTSSSTSTTATSLSDLFRTGDVSNSSPFVLAPSVDTGDIGSGNALLSGNDVSAPVASGNDIPVLSGNDTAVSDIGNVSDVANPVVNDVANPTVEGGDISGGDVNGGDIGTSVDDLVDGGDIGANVDNLVGDILGDAGLGR